MQVASLEEGTTVINYGKPYTETKTNDNRLR